MHVDQDKFPQNMLTTKAPLLFYHFIANTQQFDGICQNNVQSVYM